MNNMMKFLKYIYSLFFITSFVTCAQQDSQYTQYMYNTININPAYAGSRPDISLFALHRTQWIGLDGAPITSCASIHAPIKDSNVGLGISFVNDKIGPSDENNIAIDYSYTISISKSSEYKLAFGLKGSANLLNIDYTKLRLYDPNDLTFERNIDNKFSPNIGLGFYLYSDYTYLGLSVPNLLETKHYNKYGTILNSILAKELIHYYFILGHVFDMKNEVKFKPSVLLKMVKGAPIQLDFSGNFLINQKFLAGISYRFSSAFSAMVGFQVSNKWFIGYGYDLETTKLANYNSGSHEIFLRYEFFRNNEKIMSPRFF